VFAVALAMLSSVTLSGCVDSSIPSAPATQPADVITSMTVSPKALVMGVDDSILLSVTAKNILGETVPVAVDSAVTWVLSDSSKISLRNGMLKADATTAGNVVTATATWKHKAVTNSASVSINITPTRLDIAAIRIVAKDSTRSAPPEGFTLAWLWVKAVNAAGDSVAAPRVPVDPAESISLSQAATLYVGATGVLLGGAAYAVTSTMIGDYWLYARATVYGVPVLDSIRYTGLHPAGVKITVAKDSTSNSLSSENAGRRMIVQRCAAVKFENKSSTPIDIVFDDSTKTGKCIPSDPIGNIQNIGTNQTVIRKFPAEGTVVWTVRDRTTGTLLPSVSGRVTMKEPD
jgi:hypothetical protein